MKQEFLDSLIGLDVDKAVKKVEKNKYQSWVLPEGSIVSAIARPGMIILSENNGKVTYASMGDPTELK